MTTDPLSKAAGYDEALKAYEANVSRRSARLMELREWVETTQYHGRANWFDDSDNAPPLLQRAPCIAYPIVDAAIESNVDLVLGDGRFPEMRVDIDPSAIAGLGFDEAAGLENDDPEGDEGGKPKRPRDESAEAVTYAEDAIRKLLKVSRFKRSARLAFREAQGTTSDATIIGLRNGRPFLDVVRGEWCEPKFVGDGSGDVESLEIRYAYIAEIKGPGGEKRAVCRIYRRTIDAQRDVTYLPGEANAAGTEPRWVEDKTKTVVHGLGYCPVVWYAHMRECDTVDTIDGHAIHERCTDEIFAHDVALSLRHKAAVTLGAPTVVETGVEQGSGPGATGRTYDPASDPGAILATANGGRPSLQNPVTGFYGAGTPKKARKLGPAQLWSYDGSDVEVKLLELSAGALKALDEHAQDLRVKLAESLCVVFLDPNNLKFASTTSGKALGALKARQLDRCDQYREDFWDGWLEPALKMLLRLVSAMPGALVPSLKAIAPILASVAASAEITPEWGDYFKPTIEDEQKTVDLVIKARDAGLLSRRRALEIVGPICGVTSFDEEEDAIEAEAHEAAERAEQAASRQNAALHSAMKLANGAQDNPGAGEGAGPEPGEDAGG